MAQKRVVAADIPVIGLAEPIKHALKALAYLASEQKAMDAPRIARRLKLPAAALSKSLQRLARAGLLRASKGPGGGYSLSRPAGAIALIDVARSLKLLDSRRGRCVLERRACSGAGACLLHDAAMRADAKFRAALERLTIADLAERAA